MTAKGPDYVTLTIGTAGLRGFSRAGSTFGGATLLTRADGLSRPVTTPLHPVRDPHHRVGKRRLLAVSVSVAVHLLVALSLIPVVTGAPGPEPEPAPSPPVLVTLTPPEPARSPAPAPPPGNDPGDGAPAGKATEPRPEKAPVKAAARPSPTVPQPRVTRAPVRPPPDIPTLVAASAPASTVGQIALIGDAQLAGALTAGAGRGSGQGWGQGTSAGAGSGPGTGPGSGGGTCDMVERLQTVLRRDARIVATAAQARSTLSNGSRERGALLVWDGDWLRNPGQEGKGLAGLRQAIAVEVAFAPAACRARTVEGLVLIRLGDAPGDPGIALGTGRWRWSDLLGL